VFEYRGNLHVHTTMSDGSLPVEEVAKAAKRSGLDFVGINDHHFLYPGNRYLNGVLMLMGTELNSSHSHYLAYNIQEGARAKQISGPEAAKFVKSQGGFGFIAHPWEEGSPLVARGKTYNWQDWNSQDFDGIEVWNLSSRWKDKMPTYRHALAAIFTGIMIPFRDGPCPKALARFDEICQQRKITAIAGSDLHGPRFGKGRLSVSVLGYDLLFRAANNYVLTHQSLKGDPQEDSLTILTALRHGRSWFALDWLYPASGFRLNIGDKGMGDHVSWREGLELNLQSPQKARFRLLHNGQARAETELTQGRLALPGPGVYRVEGYLERRGKLWPWLFSNPIYLR